MFRWKNEWINKEINKGKGDSIFLHSECRVMSIAFLCKILVYDDTDNVSIHI